MQARSARQAGLVVRWLWRIGALSGAGDGRGGDRRCALSDATRPSGWPATRCGHANRSVPCNSRHESSRRQTFAGTHKRSGRASARMLKLRCTLVNTHRIVVQAVNLWNSCWRRAAGPGNARIGGRYSLFFSSAGSGSTEAVK